MPFPKRGTPEGDRLYWTVQPERGDIQFFPPVLGDDPDYPTGEDATRSVMLFAWFQENYPDDWRFIGDEGFTPFARWLRMEQSYYQLGVDELDLPGEAPVRLFQRSGLI